MKTRSQLKHRAHQRLERWIRDGRPRRLQKGLSSEVLEYIAAHPGEEGVSLEILRIIAERRRAASAEKSASVAVKS